MIEVSKSHYNRDHRILVEGADRGMVRNGEVYISGLPTGRVEELAKAIKEAGL